MRFYSALLTVFLINLASFGMFAHANSLCTPPVLSHIEIAEETAGHSINIQYPVLCTPEANRTLRDYVTSSLSTFKKIFPEHDLSDYRHKHQMLTEYAIWVTGNGRYTSVELHEMVFTGGAHPNNWPVTWVFDMTTGQIVTLSDIFINPQNALTKLEPMVRKVLIAHLGDMYVPSMLNSGITPGAQNYDDFILTEDGMTFFFAPYQVAPYAAGQQAVTIPYDQLNELLKPEFKRTL